MIAISLSACRGTIGAWMQPVSDVSLGEWSVIVAAEVRRTPIENTLNHSGIMEPLSPSSTHSVAVAMMGLG